MLLKITGETVKFIRSKSSRFSRSFSQLTLNSKFDPNEINRNYF